MSAIRKTQRKGTRNSQNVKRIKNTEHKMTLFEMFERFMNFKQTEGLAKPTIQGYYLHFRYLNDFLGGDIPNDEVMVELFRDHIGYMLHEQGLKPTTVNVRVRTNRTFLRHCYQESWIASPIHEKFKPIKTPEDEIQSFTPAEVMSLLNQIDDSRFIGFRDKVMIYVLLDTMVRISELLNMKRINVDLKSGYIKLEPHETKTKRTRRVPISTKTIKLLEEYMRESDDFGSEYLFVTYDGREIESNTWRRRLTELGERAGVSNKRVSPHTFRHTGALFYILNVCDPFSLQKILGHSDMSMVRKYIQMTDLDVKRQHNSFSPLNSIFGRR